MLGHYTAAELDSFWRHCRQLEAWSSHPAWKMNLNPELLVPILLHVDGAEMYASSEYHITSLSSFLSTLTVADIQDKKFLRSMIPHERVQHKRVRRLAWCQPSEKSKVRAAVNAHLAEVFAWSFRCAMEDCWPETGVYGEEFAKNTARHRNAGQKYKTPWRLLASVVILP